jgi:ribosomal protein L36
MTRAKYQKAMLQVNKIIYRRKLHKKKVQSNLILGKFYVLCKPAIFNLYTNYYLDKQLEKRKNNLMLICSTQL